MFMHSSYNKKNGSERLKRNKRVFYTYKGSTLGREDNQLQKGLLVVMVLRKKAMTGYSKNCDD